MDYSHGERDGESGVASPPPHDEAALTGHVPRQLQNPLAPASLPPARHLSPPSSPSQLLPDHPFNFSFPTLNLDGSLPDLAPQPSRRYPPTPPAALSSLGAKARMTRHHETSSESDFTDGQYDMIDDLSEISTDDHDTASIASNGDEGQLTPEDAGSEADADESALLASRQIDPAPSTTQSFVDVPPQLRDTVVSYTSDDLETPRQSAIPIAFSSTGFRSTAADAKASPEPEESINRIPFLSDQKHGFHAHRKTRSATYLISFRLVFALILLGLPISVPWFWTFLGSALEDPAARLAVRRAGLVTALSQATTSSNVTKDFNIDHLLSTRLNPTPHYHAVQPNHVVVSLPAVPNFPEITTTHVFKAHGREVAFNQSQLIDGIHLITFDPKEAYGIVTVSMLTRKPYLNVTAEHNYGKRMLQLKAYGQAGTDVSKTVGKDVAVMREAAKTLSDKVSTEFGAGVWATKNITTQLALYVSRDLQVFGKSAASFLRKAARAGNQTATTLSKDFVLVQRDVARFSKDLSTLVESKVAQAKNTSKALIRHSLALSRDRFQGIKKAYRRGAGRKGCKRRAKDMKKI